MKKARLVKIKLCQRGADWAAAYHDKEKKNDPHVYILAYREGPLYVKGSDDRANWRFLMGKGVAVIDKPVLWDSQFVEEIFISEETVKELESQFPVHESFKDVIYDEKD